MRVLLLSPSLPSPHEVGVVSGAAGSLARRLFSRVRAALPQTGIQNQNEKKRRARVGLDVARRLSASVRLSAPGARSVVRS